MFFHNAIPAQEALYISEVGVPFSWMYKPWFGPEGLKNFHTDNMLLTYAYQKESIRQTWYQLPGQVSIMRMLYPKYMRHIKLEEFLVDVDLLCSKGAEAISVKELGLPKFSYLYSAILSYLIDYKNRHEAMLIGESIYEFLEILLNCLVYTTHELYNDTPFNEKAIQHFRTRRAIGMPIYSASLYKELISALIYVSHGIFHPVKENRRLCKLYEFHGPINILEDTFRKISFPHESLRVSDKDTEQLTCWVPTRPLKTAYIELYKTMYNFAINHSDEALKQLFELFKILHMKPYTLAQMRIVNPIL